MHTYFPPPPQFSVKADTAYLPGWRMMAGIGLLIADYDVALKALDQINKVRGADGRTYLMYAYVYLFKVS